VISANVQLCMGGCDNMEDPDYPSMHCDFYRLIWNVVYSWLDFNMINPYHLIQFSALKGFSNKVTHRFLFDMIFYCFFLAFEIFYCLGHMERCK